MQMTIIAVDQKHSDSYKEVGFNLRARNTFTHEQVIHNCYGQGVIL